MLGSLRIGHGLPIVKHPHLLKLIKDNDIAIEMNPISGQVLRFFQDYRNHPCAILFSDNYPIVISSDNFADWRTSPLSHDFYIAFLGIAARWQDLRLLKKLSLNSIKYSAMSESEKTIAMVKWTVEWDKFIDGIVEGTDNAASMRINLDLILVSILVLMLFNF